MFERIAKWLRVARHFHVHQRGVEHLSDIVPLVDRFLNDELEYALEWDDFVSWKHSSSDVEDARENISKLEPLFFSENISDRDQAIFLLINERNRIAALCGLEHQETARTGSPFRRSGQ